MPPVQYRLSTLSEIEQIGSKFCVDHGDDKQGNIPDEEYDLIFDHLGKVLGKHGSFTETIAVDADFKGYRYVAQIPWIAIVPNDETAPPALALKAAREAIQTAHRPLAVSFDYYPNGLLALPSGDVFTTFPPESFFES
jgi:hypothetical protein